jgi:thiol-disulfide isomerase/thioredoxin
VLFEQYADSEGIADICFNMMYSRDADAGDKLQGLIDNSPHDKVKAMASFVLASMLKNKSEMDDSIGEDQYLPLFKSVVENYNDAEFRGRNLAEMAAGEIFAVENLGIGKEAPDIEGEDLDGVAFKLSDYRGKVIMLDFWGDW